MKPEPMTGPLPDEYADLLDASQLALVIREAVLAQPHQVRRAILERPDLGVKLGRFDDDGYVTVSLPADFDDVSSGWTPFLRLHWTRLMPGASTALPS